MNVFSLVVTIAVLLAIALAILLFEKQRAQEIERDLGEMAQVKRKRRRGRADE